MWILVVFEFPLLAPESVHAGLRLLLVHGHWCLQKVLHFRMHASDRRVITYKRVTFEKNRVVFTFAMCTDNPDNLSPSLHPRKHVGGRRQQRSRVGVIRPAGRQEGRPAGRQASVAS